MTGYIVRRLGVAVIVVIGVAAITFAILHYLSPTPAYAVLGTKAMIALESIQEALSLDYAGIDFGLSQQGEVLLFEANATMVVEQPSPDSCWDYRRAAVQRIHAAVRQMLLKGLGQ